MKIARACEVLTDDPGTHEFPISFHELAIGFVREEQLGQSRDYQRVEHAKKRCRHQGEPNCNQQVPFHKQSLKPVRGKEEACRSA